MCVRTRPEQAKMVQLNVYANNPRARAVYERLGYEVTGVTMTKVLAR